jgi:hypothetical protein
MPAKVNTDRIDKASDELAVYQNALLWLLEYGEKLSGSNIKFAVELPFSGSVTGASGAAKVIASCARLNIADLVKDATQMCRNTIGLSVAAIQEEVDKAHELQVQLTSRPSSSPTEEVRS